VLLEGRVDKTKVAKGATAGDDQKVCSLSRMKVQPEQRGPVISLLTGGKQPRHSVCLSCRRLS